MFPHVRPTWWNIHNTLWQLSNQSVSTVTFTWKLTLASQCYLAPEQRTHCANYSLASNILTNFPEALGLRLNRILSTAQWHKVSIKQPVCPDTSDLMDGSWQWMIISECQWAVLPNLKNSDINLWMWAYKQHHRNNAVRSALILRRISCVAPPHTLICKALTQWNTQVSKRSICSSQSTPQTLL